MTEPQPRCRQFTLGERNQHFPLDYDVEVERNGKVSVRVPAKWEATNLARLEVRDVFRTRVHKTIAHIFDAWFMLANESGAIREIETYDGAFYARLKRGVTLPPTGSPKSAYDKLLSNHSRGTAIDLNARWNRMGKPGAARGKEGSLHAMQDLARSIRIMQPNGEHWGIVCGADWRGTSIDPMHFEIGVWPA